LGRIAAQQAVFILPANEREGFALRFRLQLGEKIPMSGLRARSAAILLVLTAIAPFLAACDQPDAAQASVSTQAVEPDVSIVTIKPQARSIVRELPGRIAPVRVADVRPRVSGIIVERLFRQGSEVKEGDPLYRVDQRPFEVEVQANQAALAKAQATHDRAVQQARRISFLARERAAPEIENEKAIAAEKESAADVEARKADLARARLSLDYSTIRAPIDGIVGAAQLSEGALVVQNDTATLATIQQIDPVYADFTEPVSELLRLRRAFEAGDLERIAPDAIKVRLVLDDGTLYPVAGKLLFSEAKVEAATGQVTLRGEFANPKRELLPGMYVRVRIEQGIDSDAIAVPEQSVQRNSGGGSEVYIVKDDNRVAPQAVRTGALQDGQWLVTEGLKAGDRIVVEGFQKFVAGDKVKPLAWTEAADASNDVVTSQTATAQR
jgi:membrane fusion protein (multidrug efflux system)